MRERLDLVDTAAAGDVEHRHHRLRRACVLHRFLAAAIVRRLRDAVQAIGHNRAQHHEPIYREELRGVACDREMCVLLSLRCKLEAR